MYEIKVTTEQGRGLYCNVRTIKRNTVICVCEVLPLSSHDTELVNKTNLVYYTFKYDYTDHSAKKDCLVLGDGELFNHDDCPNVSYALIECDGRKLMEFRAVTDIHNGEQLLIDYNDDMVVDTKAYVKAKSLL